MVIDLFSAFLTIKSISDQFNLYISIYIFTEKIWWIIHFKLKKFIVKDFQIISGVYCTRFITYILSFQNMNFIIKRYYYYLVFLQLDVAILLSITITVITQCFKL